MRRNNSGDTAVGVRRRRGVRGRPRRQCPLAVGVGPQQVPEPEGVDVVPVERALEGRVGRGADGVVGSERVHVAQPRVIAVRPLRAPVPQRRGASVRIRVGPPVEHLVRQPRHPLAPQVGVEQRVRCPGRAVLDVEHLVLVVVPGHEAELQRPARRPHDDRQAPVDRCPHVVHGPGPGELEGRVVAALVPFGVDAQPGHRGDVDPAPVVGGDRAGAGVRGGDEVEREAGEDGQLVAVAVPPAGVAKDGLGAPQVGGVRLSQLDPVEHDACVHGREAWAS